MHSSTAPPILYRTMTPADIAAGMALCRASRWNQTQRDWELFLRLGPHGCRVAVKDGQVVGTVATVNYAGRFAWIGMVLVDPAQRQQGIGTQLLHEALAVLRAIKSVRLDATPAGQPVYRKLGFMEEYGLSRLEASGVSFALPAVASSVRPMTEADLPGVSALDQQVFGADRRVLLEWLRAGAPAYAWVAAHNGQVTGYCFGRHGFTFEHIGPVIATERDIARQLVSACLRGQAGRPVILDAAHHDTEWLRWLASIGFREQRPFIRMFHGENLWPGLPERQFAILGPEFG